MSNPRDIVEVAPPSVPGAAHSVSPRFSFVEIYGDLFGTPSPTASLAHCVSKDLHMGKGIAVHFKKMFGRVQELIQQKKGVGEVAYIKARSPQSPGNDIFVFYLITKPKYWQKPTLQSLRQCLIELCSLCEMLDVKELAMPKIGCGLDGLKWEDVRDVIGDVFASSNVEITVCHFGG